MTIDKAGETPRVRGGRQEETDRAAQRRREAGEKQRRASARRDGDFHEALQRAGRRRGEQRGERRRQTQTESELAGDRRARGDRGGDGERGASSAGEAKRAGSDAAESCAPKQGEDRAGRSSTGDPADHRASGAEGPTKVLDGAAGGARGPGAAQRAPIQPQHIERLAERMVQAVAVGRDEQRRRVVMLDVTVPGRGDLRVRMRRDGTGYRVRLRADHPGMARELEQRSSQLKQAVGRRGVTVSRIAVEEGRRQGGGR